MTKAQSIQVRNMARCVGEYDRTTLSIWLIIPSISAIRRISPSESLGPHVAVTGQIPRAAEIRMFYPRGLCHGGWSRGHYSLILMGCYLVRHDDTNHSTPTGNAARFSDQLSQRSMQTMQFYHHRPMFTEGSLVEIL